MRYHEIMRISFGVNIGYVGKPGYLFQCGQKPGSVAVADKFIGYRFTRYILHICYNHHRNKCSQTGMSGGNAARPLAQQGHGADVFSGWSHVESDVWSFCNFTKFGSVGRMI